MKQLIHILCLLCLAFPVSAVPTAETDTLLRVLREELAADFSELQQQDVKPYFMSFRVQETWKANIIASFGYLSTSQQKHTRTFTPQIRVGTPELDNFKFYSQSMGDPMPLPLTDTSPDALRNKIWEMMLQAYLTVTGDYRRAQDKLRSQSDHEDKAPCFSVLGNSPAEAYYEAPLSAPALAPDEQHAWEERLCRIAAVFRQHPEFNRADASLQVENQRTHLVNTEGTSVVQNRCSYRVFLEAQIKTEDGMVLPLMQSYFATSLDSLPAEDVMVRDAGDIARRLVALSQAPVADPYTGPALMSGEASGVFFHEIFGHRLEGHRMKTGGQTFRKMVGERVLPADFQVYCDPTLTHYGSQPLNGGYVYDDEGTRARRVNNVVDGVLREFLMSRVPLDGFPESNGHGRTAEGRNPVSRQSNLVVETRHPYTEAELRQMLRDEARRQGKEYGYLFQSASSGFTYTGEGGSINSFDVTPLEVFRIYVDGRPDELVRGVELIGTPLAMFSNIAAAGDTPSTFIGVCGAESGWVPVSATSPMVFCANIETQRHQRKAALMPELAPPPFRIESGTSQNENPDDIIFQALSDEMQRSMDSLRIDGQPAPFIIDYRLQRARTMTLTATMGELYRQDIEPWKQKMDAEVILGDYRRTSLRWAEASLRGSEIPMALDYGNLRRQAWLAINSRYREAISTLEDKKQKQTSLPADEEALDDLIPAQPATSIQHRSPEAEELHVDEMVAYARRLSFIANECPEAIQSEARIQVRQTDMYRLSSEGVRVAQPQNDECVIAFSLSCDFNKAGYEKSHTYACPAEALADSARFTRELREYLAQLFSILHAPTSGEEYYVGPVLIEDKASSNIYYRTSDDRHFLARHPYNESNRKIFNRMNRKIVDEKLTIRQDPSLSQWEGKPLAGYYTADANGQKPQAVTLIEHGILCGQLCGRTPSLNTSTPTGNLRFYNPAYGNNPMGIATAPGVLRIESSKTVPLKKMRRQLLRNARREGYDHAYIMRGEFCYRVSVKDGSETPMKRPYNTIKLTNLRHIDALSTEQEAVTAHGPEGGPHASIVGPKAMLLSDIEVSLSSLASEQSKELPLTNPKHRRDNP